MKRLKVLFLTPWFPDRENLVDGIFIREHAKAVSLYNDVVVMHLQGYDRQIRKFYFYKEETVAGIKTIRVKYGRFSIPRMSFLNLNLTTIFAVRKMVKEGFEPDIIHANVYSSSIPAVIIGKLFKIPVVITEHSSSFPRKILSKKEIKKAKFAMQRAEVVLPVCEYLRKSIDSYGIKNRFQIIPNAVDTNIFYPDGQIKKDINIKRILLVALLNKSIKGVPYLFQALHILKKERNDFFLDIIGDGLLRKEYENLAVKLGIDEKVCFQGIKSKQEIAEFMRKSHFSVLPSLWENLPCVLIESLSCGRPVIASRVGGIPEIISKEIGLLVPPKNVNALAEAISCMLDHYQEYSPEQISQYAKDKFSYEVVGKDLNKIYQGLARYKGAQKNESPHLLKVPKVPIVHGRVNFILKKCRGKKVLHLGCVDESLTEERIKRGVLMHIRLLEVAKKVWGVDISAPGISLLRGMGIGNLIEGDVEHLDTFKEIEDQNFDIILATEILEHLNNPGLFLQKVKKLFSRNTEMIITVPNGLRLTGCAHQFRGYELVHPDHNYWFSYHTLKSLIEKSEYVILEVLAYSFVNHLESIPQNLKRRIIQAFLKRIPMKNNYLRAKFKQSKIGSNNVPCFTFRWAAETLIRRFLYRKNPFFSDGIIFIVKPK